MAWGVPKIGAIAAVASGNITVAEPAGIAVGDLMVIGIAYRDSATFTVPGDWNLVATQQSSGDVATANGIASGLMAWTIRGASAPTLTFNRTSGNLAQAQILAYSGGHASAPYDTGSANTLAVAATLVSTGTLTTAEDGELLVALGAAGDNFTVSAFRAVTDPSTSSGTVTDTTTAPSDGVWLRRSMTGTNTGADGAISMADAVRATAGATGELRCTTSNTARSVLIVGAFKLAVAGANQSFDADAAVVRALGVDPTFAVGGVAFDASPAVVRVLAINPTIVIGGLSFDAVAALVKLGAVDITMSTIISQAFDADPAVVRALVSEPGFVAGGVSFEGLPAIVRVLAVDPGITRGGVAFAALPATSRVIAVVVPFLASSNEAFVVDPAVVRLIATLLTTSPQGDSDEALFQRARRRFR